MRYESYRREAAPRGRGFAMEKKISSRGRLQLSRETLRTLSNHELANVGGATGDAAQCQGGPVDPGSNNYQMLCQDYRSGGANASSIPAACTQLPTTISVISISIRFP